MESNGPDTKVRGPASHIYERYLQLARDAASSGDRVLSENYMQHADHYFRLWRSMQPAQPIPQPQDRFNEGDEGEEGRSETEGAESAEAAAEGEDQPDVDFPQGPQQQGGNFDRAEGSGRRRGRRNRFRPEGEGAVAEAREGGGEDRGERPPRRERAEGENRENREDRGERRERAPRDDREGSGREGFSDGPKPAFLRGD